jgi:hypothetical protein
MLVAPDTTEDDVVLLSSLERIHARHFDFFVQVLLQRAMQLHVRCNIGPLAFVGRDDTNLRREHAGFEEFGDHLLHVGGFRSIEE